MRTWRIIPALLAAVVVATLPLQAAIAGENTGSCVESAVAVPELDWGVWMLLPEWEVSLDIRDDASGSNPPRLASERRATGAHGVLDAGEGGSAFSTVADESRGGE